MVVFPYVTRTLIACAGAIALAPLFASSSSAALTVGTDGVPLATTTPLPSLALDRVRGLDDFVSETPVAVDLNERVGSNLNRVPEAETVVMIAAGGILVMLSRFRRRRH